MLHQQYVTQPDGGINYLSLFDVALAQRPFDGFDVAVAYATANGVRELTQKCRAVAGRDWDSMDKRWLVGIDYCRTEPIAIEMLANESHSKHDVRQDLSALREGQVSGVLPDCIVLKHLLQFLWIEHSLQSTTNHHTNRTGFDKRLEPFAKQHPCRSCL